MSANRIIPGLFFLLIGLILLGWTFGYEQLMEIVAGICAVVIGILYLVRGL